MLPLRAFLSVRWSRKGRPWGETRNVRVETTTRPSWLGESAPKEPALVEFGAKLCDALAERTGYEPAVAIALLRGDLVLLSRHQNAALETAIELLPRGIVRNAMIRVSTGAFGHRKRMHGSPAT